MGLGRPKSSFLGCWFNLSSFMLFQMPRTFHQKAEIYLFSIKFHTTMLLLDSKWPLFLEQDFRMEKTLSSLQAASKQAETLN